MSGWTLHRARIFTLEGDPAVGDAPEALRFLPSGALLVDPEGIIRWVGERDALPDEAAQARVIDHGDAFLLPGFIDTHLHYPQAFSLDSFAGGQLLPWLERCIFPQEARFADVEFASRAAAHFTEQLVRHGTTTSLILGSAFPQAQEQLFGALEATGLRAICGRGVQTVAMGADRPLVTGEDEAIRLCQDEIERWHPVESERARALIQVALVPRFSLSVTTHTLAALGELYESVRSRGVYFTSHISENDAPEHGEVSLVRKRFGVKEYIDTYDGRFLPGSKVGGKSLLGPRSILAHGVWCTDYELARMAETGSTIAHCPVSQQFLASGTMPWRRTVAAGVGIGCGSDICAGDEWFIPRVLNCGFKVHLSAPGADSVALHPAELLHLGTLGGAQALDLSDRIGTLEVGKEFDAVLLDPDRQPELALRLALNADVAPSASAFTEATLFGLLMGARQPAVAGVWVQGRRLR